MPTVQESIDSLHVEAQALEDIINGPSTGVGSAVTLSGGGTQDSIAKMSLLFDATGKLDFDSPQTLTEAQQLQGRLNIGLDGIEFYDDFDRADTAIGVLSDAPGGEVYIVRNTLGLGPGTTDVQISSGEVISTRDGTHASVYFGGDFLTEKCFNIGAEVVWEYLGDGAGGPTQIVFLIKNDGLWLDDLIHVRASRFGWYIEITDSGAASFEILAQGAFADVIYKGAAGDNATSVNFEVVIIDDTIYFFGFGQLLGQATDARVSDINGTEVYWQMTKGNDGATYYDDMRIRKIWANDSRKDNFLVNTRAQPYSAALADLARGKLTVWNSGEITHGDLNVLGGGINIPAGILTAQNIERDIDGSTFTVEITGGIPKQSGRFLTAVANTSAGITTFSDANRIGVSGAYLAEQGDRVVFYFEGTYAANGDSKHIKFNHAGLIGDTLATTQNGGAWQMRAEVGLDAGEVNRTLAWSFIDDRGARCGRTTAAALGLLAVGETVVGGLQLAGTNIGDVTCETAYREVHQMPK
mgnify:CR=1 FL=1